RLAQRALAGQKPVVECADALGHHPVEPPYLRDRGLLHCLTIVKEWTMSRAPPRACSKVEALTLPIEDYAMIGDCETAALVACDGSIDWLCWPRFDSDACFAALLGGEQHGRWLIGPADPSAARAVSRRYRGDSLILETRFESKTGAAVVIDVMPPRDSESNLLRIVVGERGSLEMRSTLVTGCAYGARMPWVHRLPDRSLRAIAGADQVVLRTAVAVEGEDGRTVGRFTVSAGETVTFALSYAPSHL